MYRLPSRSSDLARPDYVLEVGRKPRRNHDMHPQGPIIARHYTSFFVLNIE